MSKSIFFNPHCIKVTLAEKEVVPLSLSFTLCEARYVVYLLSLISLCTQWRGHNIALVIAKLPIMGVGGISKFSSRFQELLCSYGHCLHGWARTVTFQWVLVKDKGQESVMA